MNWQNITDLPDKATIPVNLAFTAIGVEDQRAALLKIAAKGITLLEEREIPLIVRETLAMIRANSLSGQPAHDDKVELVPVPSIDRYLIESDLLAHLYISKEDLLAVREELQRDNAPAGDHEKPVIGWKKLEAALPATGVVLPISITIIRPCAL